MLDRHRVVVVPPDDRIGVGVADDELVLRAAAGVDAGVGDQRSVGGDMRLVAAQGVLVELRRAEVPANARQIAEAEAIRAVVGVVCAGFDHPEVPPEKRAEKRKILTHGAAPGYAALGPKTIVKCAVETKLLDIREIRYSFRLSAGGGALSHPSPRCRPFGSTGWRHRGSRRGWREFSRKISVRRSVGLEDVVDRRRQANTLPRIRISRTCQETSGCR